MHKHLTALLAAGVLVTGGGLAFAHHPFAAEYDSNKPAQVEGKVTKVTWTNPHSFVTIAVKGASGKLEHYRVELGSVRALGQKGLKRGVLRVGQTVTVDGWYGRDDQTRINARALTVNGKEFDAASSFNEAAAN
jgi:Family of unknown function (DUF6152)